MIGNTLHTRALYDTGAGPNCMSEHIFKHALRLQQVKARVPAKLTHIRTASGHNVDILGVFIIRIKVQNKVYEGPFTVLSQLSSPIIIGMVGAKAMQLDFSVTDGTFIFRDEQETRPFKVTSRKTTIISPKLAAKVHCLVTENEAPVRNETVVAEVNGTEVLATTDANGQFCVVISNPASAPLTFAKDFPFGEAYSHKDSEFACPITSDAQVSALSQAVSGKPTQRRVLTK